MTKLAKKKTRKPDETKGAGAKAVKQASNKARKPEGTKRRR
jgi:hypothetical protein